jgi:hypothetical protein
MKLKKLSNMIGMGFLGCQGHVGWNPYWRNGRCLNGEWQRHTTIWPGHEMRVFWWKAYLRQGD